MLDCLIVGGDSAIGRALASNLDARGLSVGATSRRDDRGDGTAYLDLETLAGLDALPAARTVTLLAAETRFAVCAAEPERTRAINVVAPDAIAARAIADWQARVLFFSSIAVHDGSVDKPPEEAWPTPNSVYGEQKLAAEDLLRARGANIAVLRPSKVVEPVFPLFDGWLDALDRGETIEPFSDMLVSPVWIDDVADVAAGLLLDTSKTGIFQYSASDQLSYADVAARLAAGMGHDPARVSPVLAAERLDPATLWLPDSARLGCDRLDTAIGVTPPPSERAVAAYLESRRGRP